MAELTLLSLSAAAQGNQGPHKAEGGRSAGIEKEVRFEVLSIRPISPNTPVTSRDYWPSPKGYRSALNIWQALMLAFVSGDYLKWDQQRPRNIPKWSGDNYDFQGQVSSADLKAWQSQSAGHELLRSALRNALKERCKRKVHEELAQGPNIALEVGTKGPRLKTAAPGCTLPGPGIKLPSGGSERQREVSGRIVADFRGATMEDLVSYLQLRSIGVPVRDNTRLTGKYDFSVEGIEVSSRQNDLDLSNFALDRLGPRIKTGKESSPVFVIDYMERPSAN